MPTASNTIQCPSCGSIEVLCPESAAGYLDREPHCPDCGVDRRLGPKAHFATPTELDAAIREHVKRIRAARQEPPEIRGFTDCYRCPRCGSAEIRCDGEIWCVIDPNTGEVVSDVIGEPAVIAGQDGPDEPHPENCYTCCNDCDFESQRLADFRDET